MKKTILIFSIIIICLSMFCSNIYAGFTDPITNPGAYEPSTNSQSDNTKFMELGGQIIGVIRIFGTLISVVTLMTLGIRYMLASAHDKALYKETLGPYLIGAIMLFAIPNIISVLYYFIKNNIK